MENNPAKNKDSETLRWFLFMLGDKQYGHGVPLTPEEQRDKKLAEDELDFRHEPRV